MRACGLSRSSKVLVMAWDSIPGNWHLLMPIVTIAQLRYRRCTQGMVYHIEALKKLKER